MNPFQFEPELFSYRASVIEILNRAGYEWPTHFNSIDLIHDRFGLEVCGIAEKRDALGMLRILRQALREWRFYHLSYKERGRDTGWKVVIHREPDTDIGPGQLV